MARDANRQSAYSLMERKTTRRGFVKTSALVASLAGTGSALGAYSGATAAPTSLPLSQESPVRGGTLTVLIQNDWVTLDPLYNSAEPNGTDMIYGHWVRWGIDPDTGIWGPVPDMIADWELGEDEVVLTLQSGISFHDGTPWDAEAAKWNLDRMIFDPASTVQAYLGAVDTGTEDEAALEEMRAAAGQTFDFSSNAVEIVDDLTVRVRLSEPSAPFINVLSQASQWNNPICPTAYKELGKDAFGRNPVGAGPFRFVEWQSGNQVILERNPDYWRTDDDGEPLPYLDRIVYRLVIDDSVRLLDLQSGNADFSELIQGRDVEGVEADPNLTLLQSESQGNNYRLIFDSTNEDSVFVKHKELRQAILYAMDRDAMAEVLGFGAGYGRRYLLPRGSVAYDESLPSYWFDRELAEQLVQDVLAEDPSVANGDGRIAVTLTVIDREVDRAQAEMIKQMADAVGFDVTIDILERAAWTATLVRTPGQEGGTFDFATMRNPVTADDPDLQWRTFYHSAGGFNVAHLSDPELDELLDSAAATYDTEARVELYHELARIAYDDPWYGYLWQQNWNWAFSSRLHNFEEVPTNRWLFTATWLED